LYVYNTTNGGVVVERETWKVERNAVGIKGLENCHALRVRAEARNLGPVGVKYQPGNDSRPDLSSRN